MSKYHDRTLNLLGLDENLWRHPVPDAVEWAKEKKIEIPASVLEWAELDGERLLERFSNSDRFCVGTSEIITVSDKIRGLFFQQENQGNFTEIVLLDRGDDPPVLFAWIESPPWVVHSESFSDRVFAQIFDLQYQLEFDEDGNSEITYFSEIGLKTDCCLSLLRDRYEETVQSKFIVEDEEYSEYRFFKSLKE